MPRRTALSLGVAAAAAALLMVSGAAHGADTECGAVLVASTTLDGDLLACPGDALIVGADGITIDLNGNSIVGAGLGAGIRNDGFDNVTIKNGAVQGFLYGVELNPGTVGNVVAGLNVTGNKAAGVELDGATQNQLRSSIMEAQANDGVVLVGGSNANVIRG